MSLFHFLLDKIKKAVVNLVRYLKEEMSKHDLEVYFDIQISKKTYL